MARPSVRKRKRVRETHRYVECPGRHFSEVAMTQTEAIRRHILKHNSITPLEALRKYRCFRLAARIRELRADGFSVQTAMISRAGRRYAKYVMG